MALIFDSDRAGRNGCHPTGGAAASGGAGATFALPFCSSFVLPFALPFAFGGIKRLIFTSFFPIAFEENIGRELSSSSKDNIQKMWTVSMVMSSLFCARRVRGDWTAQLTQGKLQL